MPTVTISHAKDGHAVLNINEYQDEQGNLLNNYQLSSQYAPLKEATRILEFDTKNNKNNSYDLVVLFGCGHLPLTHLLLKKVNANKNRDNLPILIIENLTELKTTCQAWLRENHSKLLENKIYWLDKSTGDEELRRIFKNHGVKQVAFFQNQKQIRIFEQFYSEFKSRIIKIHNERSSNRSTFAKFEKLWLRNITKNTTPIIKSFPLLATHNQGKEHPAIVVGAGPSLELALPTLYEQQQKFTIIACDTAVKVLLKHNITPDLIITIDPQKINSKYLENLPALITEKSILVCEPGVMNQGMRDFTHIMMFDTIFPYYTFLVKHFNVKGEIDIGGTVLTAAYEVARMLNFKATAFIGMDFCFTENSYHLKGSMYEEVFFSILHRYQTFEMFFAKTINHDVSETTNRLGKVVYTDKKFMLFKNWFEKKLSLDQPNYTNCTYSGLEIKNLPYLDFEDFIQKEVSVLSTSKDSFLLSLRKQISEYKNIHSLANPKFGITFKHFKNQFNELLLSLKDYHKLLSKALKHIRNHQISAAMAMQEEILQGKAARIAKPFTEIIIQKTLYETTSFTGNEKEMVKALENLYQALRGACELNLKYLRKVQFEGDLVYQDQEH